MAGKRYGDPTYAFRLPRAVLDALRTEAATKGTTVSDILRELAIEELTRRGYTFTQKPIEGQMQISV